jgi:hypothetical protein
VPYYWNNYWSVDALNSSDEKATDTKPEGPFYGVTYPQPLAELTLKICSSSSRKIRIVSPQLDHRIFDNPELVDALSALARRDRNSSVHILISDSRPIINDGHRVLNLARRLPSSVSIRKLADHPEMTGDTIIIRDLDGVIFMPEDGGPGFYEPDSRSSAQLFINKFEPLWQRSVQDPEFRRLGL